MKGLWGEASKPTETLKQLVKSHFLRAKIIIAQNNATRQNDYKTKKTGMKKMLSAVLSS